MTGTALDQVEAQDLQHRRELNRAVAAADVMAASSLVRADLRGKPEDVRAIAVTLHQYGLPVGIQNINACYVVKGRVEFMTHLWVGLALRYGGHRVWLDPSNSATTATAWIQRAGDGDAYSATFTIEDAKRAGLDQSETYKKYPQDMLGWRALSRVIRRYAPEVMAGIADAGPETVARARPRPVPADDVDDDVVDGEIVEPDVDDEIAVAPPGPAVDAEQTAAAADRENGGGEATVVGSPPPAPGPVDWRALCRKHGVSQGDLLRQAQEFARGRALPVPETLAEITDEQHQADLLDWLGEPA